MFTAQVPSGELFRRYGRYLGFSGGCACQIVGSFLGGIGMISKSPVLLFFGCSFAGLGQVCLCLPIVLNETRDWANFTGSQLAPLRKSLP